MDYILDFIKITIVNIFCVYFFQSLMYVLGIYFFSKMKINWKKFFLCSSLSMIATYFIRLLPINFGVHTIFSLIVLIFLAIYILKVPIQAAIKGSLTITIAILASEMIIVIITSQIIGSNELTTRLSDPMYKAFVGFLTDITLGVFILLFFLIYKKLNKKKEI